MFLTVKKSGAALLLIAAACSASWAAPPEKRIPLTGFQPSKDFIQIPNDPRFGPGSCLGAVESAIAHFDPTRPEDDRLASLGREILLQRLTEDSQGKTEGEKFLQEINTYAQNHSQKNAVVNPHTGDRLADLLLAELTRTKQPQVLGYDQPSENLPGEWEHKHSLVVYDAEKTPDGKIVFSAGDPNYPDKDDLRLVYDPNTGDWADLNFPPVVRGPDGRLRPLIRGFRPCFVHWDEKRQKMAGIPQIKTLRRLMERVKDAAKNKNLTARAIGTELQLLTPVPWMLPSTVVDLDRPEDIPRPTQHPFVGSWTITSGISSGRVWTVDAGGAFTDSVFPAPGVWRSTGDNSAEAVLTWDTPGLAFTATYRVTIHNGHGDVVWSSQARQGIVDPDHGSFTIEKR
jgi:hypothetical protein